MTTPGHPALSPAATARAGRDGTRPGSPAVISLAAASFGYAEHAVVSGVTLDIRPGEVVAVLGPNGSGKSTLVRGLLGLTDHLRGRVTLFGRPLADFSDRARIGYVPQRHTLGTSVRSTVAEIVAIGRLPHRRWWAPWRRSATDERRIVTEALGVVGLADRSGADVTTLSGGQQRRVLIARALAAEPDILVMDEPTAGVDLTNQQMLTDVLARLVDRGSTMVIVTHELAAIANIVSRVVEVRAGKVVFDGDCDAYAVRRGGTTDGHHHDEDEVPLEVHLPGSPTRGPLDPDGGEPRA